MAHKAVMLIVDGMGDLPVPELHGLTPLEAAFTPNLNRLASAGLYGQVDPIAPGVIPNTDSGTGMLMGMRPEHASELRRGPVEAAGASWTLQQGDVAMRANFASVKQIDGELLVVDRRAGRIKRDVPELLEILAAIPQPDQVEIQLRATDQHRVLLVLSGEGLDGAISDTDPGDDSLPALLLQSQAGHPTAQKTADVLNRFLETTHQVLQNHELNQRRIRQGKLPANALITRGAGESVAIGNVVSEGGFSAVVVSGCNTVRGLGSLFGFEVVRDARFTATRETDIEAKIACAIAALENHDLVFVHLKAPDLCAHDLQPLIKMEVLQRFDAALKPLLEQDIIIACAADHSTDSNSGKHTADPVPSLLYAPGESLEVNAVKFGESACRNGNMPRQTSSEFLKQVLALMRPH